MGGDDVRTKLAREADDAPDWDGMDFKAGLEAAQGLYAGDRRTARRRRVEEVVLVVGSAMDCNWTRR